MQLTLIILVIAAHVVAPLLFIGWVGFSRARSKVYALSVALLTLAYLALMHVAGAGWAWVGTYWIYVFWALYVLALGRMFRGGFGALPTWPEKKFTSWAGFVVVLLVALFLLSSVPSLIQVRTVYEDTVELYWPFDEGTFFVGHGGDGEIVNHHYPVEAQRYALDVLKLNAFGTRASGLWPEELDAYEIYGAALHSPCTGEVVRTEGELPDLPPPEADRENLAGNFVAVYCQEVTVVIAHMQAGSVVVEVGDEVQRGQPIGRVGNSGNTSEPHLHIHAVRGRVTDMQELLFEGQGVPMTFNGRFLVRNDRVAVR